MEPKIVGTVMPVLELNMQPNEKVFAESGQLSWMSAAIQMQTSTTAGGQQGGRGRNSLHDGVHVCRRAGPARVRGEAARADPPAGDRAWVRLHGPPPRL